MNTLRIMALICILQTVLCAQPVTEPDATDQDIRAGSEIQWFKMTNGLKHALATRKKMLVHVCADWCPWCKEMDQKVYGAKEIDEYVSMRFVPIRLDGEGKDTAEYRGERLTESALAEKFGTKGYPTTVFLDSDGEFLVKLDGYMNKEIFHKVLQYIGEDIYERQSFADFAGTSLPRQDGNSSSARDH